MHYQPTSKASIQLYGKLKVKRFLRHIFWSIGHMISDSLQTVWEFQTFMIYWMKTDFWRIEQLITHGSYYLRPSGSRLRLSYKMFFNKPFTFYRTARLWKCSLVYTTVQKFEYLTVMLKYTLFSCSRNISSTKYF